MADLADNLVGNMKEQLEEAVVNHRFYKYHLSILDVSPELVAKKHKNNLRAAKEFNLGVELYQNGISVPEMYGILTLDDYCSVACSYILMQKISGTEICFLIGEERKKAVRQFKDEIKKVLELGIVPKDADWYANSIFNSEADKVYLIDFELWESATSPLVLADLNYWRNILRINEDLLTFRMK